MNERWPSDPSILQEWFRSIAHLGDSGIGQVANLVANDPGRVQSAEKGCKSPGWQAKKRHAF
jgi:hypothetical protein